MTKTARKAARIASATSVVIYARVSSEEQARSGAGIDGQIAECLGYAERTGLTVVAIHRDEAMSGKVPPSNRPGFAQVLTLLDDCSACGVLVRRTDRISRSTKDFLALVDVADKDGWSIITTDGKVDTRSAAGRFQLKVMAAANEYERDLISERTREALASRKAAGVRLGNGPGVPAEIAERIVAAYAAGSSLSGIAADLTADGVQAARGGPFTKSGVQSVLRSRSAS